nr:MAG TPA: hypothetical protein [Caudoviricetes sp.]
MGALSVTLGAFRYTPHPTNTHNIYIVEDS